MRNVLLLKAGDAHPSVRGTIGDYDRWFVQAIGEGGLRYQTVQAHLGEKLPDSPAAFDAVIMTGSPLSVTEPADWMKRAAAWMRDAAAREVPVLGVCFGHQLLAWTFGAPIVRNPEGREIGTIQVTLTSEGSADPLFEGLPPRFAVQATHEDIAERLPAGLTLLAHNQNTRVQAFAEGRCLRAVQFHPELQTDTMSALIRARAEKLDAEGRARGFAPGERVTKLLAGVRPSPYGPRILTNFVRHFT